MANLAKNPKLGAKGLENGLNDVDNAPHSDDPIPSIFTDPGYATLGHSTLSTSNCGNPCLRLFGFGAVVPDGFGIGYIIKVSYLRAIHGACAEIYFSG